MPTTAPPYLLLADDVDLRPGITPFIFSLAVKLNLPTSLRSVMTSGVFYGPIAAFQDILIYVTTSDQVNVKFRIHIGLTTVPLTATVVIADFTPTQNIVNDTTYVLAFQRTLDGTEIDFSINGTVVNAFTVDKTYPLNGSIPAGRSICLGIPGSDVITGAIPLPDNPTTAGSIVIDDVFVQLSSAANNTFKYRLRTSSFDV